MSESKRLDWGRPIPSDAKVGMGARAILKCGYPPYIDFLHDRMSWDGTPDDCRELSSWINRTAVPQLKKQMMDMGISTMSSEVLTVEDGAFRLEASPQASGGYLYIGAWKVDG